MARMEYLEEQQATGKVDQIYQQVKKQNGMVLNLLKMMGHSPQVLESFLPSVGVISGKTSLSGAQKELSLLTVAKINGCEYCQGHHGELARKAGVSEEKIAAVPDADSKAFSEEEKLIVRYASKITKDVSARDETFAKVKEQFSKEQVVELTYLIGLMNLLTRFADTLEVDLEG